MYYSLLYPSESLQHIIFFYPKSKRLSSFLLLLLSLFFHRCTRRVLKNFFYASVDRKQTGMTYVSIQDDIPLQHLCSVHLRIIALRNYLLHRLSQGYVERCARAGGKREAREGDDGKERKCNVASLFLSFLSLLSSPISFK